MDKDQILDIAQYLYDAELNRQETDKITLQKAPEISIAEAYQIQKQLNQLKVADGQKIYAPKLGLTSPAKMKQMNVDHPIYGYVFYYMLVKNFGEIHLRDYIHAKVEPEIAVVLKNELQGPGVTLSDVEKQLDYVVSSLEILDSRYRNYEFTLPDVIADNTSARGFVYSKEKIYLNPRDLMTETVVLSINGEMKVKGNGAAVLGNPLKAIVFLANELGKSGEKVPANVPIMTGGMTAAVDIKAGDLIEVEYQHLGEIKVQVKS